MRCLFILLIMTVSFFVIMPIDLAIACEEYTFGAHKSVTLTDGGKVMAGPKTESLGVINETGNMMLRITGIEHSDLSFTVRFYLNWQSKSQLALPDEDSHAATFYMYGHGGALADNKTLLKLQPFDNEIDFSKGQRMIKINKENSLTYIVLDGQGSLLSPSEFKYQKIQLVVDE